MPVPETPQVAEDEIGKVVNRAVEDQHIIGWDNFMKGRICHKWKIAQSMYHSALPKSKKNKSFDWEQWADK
eukprot:14707688-Ditylum_brightwellii.AAC.2